VALTISLFCIGELKNSITGVTELAICFSRLKAEHVKFCNFHAKTLVPPDLMDSDHDFFGPEMGSHSESERIPNKESSLYSDQKSKSLSGNRKSKNLVCQNWQLDSRILQTGCYFRIKNVVNKS
jgi:hypothetical protein